MKEISYGKSACILLFSALGVFSYFLLLYHTELQERIPDIKISLIALSITIAVFNLFGFSLLVSSNWMATNYPLYYIDKSRMLWHYLLVAILLLLMNWRSFRDPGKRGRFSNSRLVRGDDHFQPSLD